MPRIHLVKLEEGMRIAEPVYVKTDAGADMLVVRKDTVATDRIIRVLARHGVETVEVCPSGAGEAPPPPPLPPKPHPKPQPEPLLKPPGGVNLRPEAKARYHRIVFESPPPEPVITEELQKATVESISRLFTAFGEPGEVVNFTTAYQAVSEFEQVLSQVVSAVTDDPSGLIHIHDLKSYDEYTYHHSMSVALLSVATGQMMGFDSGQLLRLGRCAMLHDIGKQAVPLEIINKPGKLTPEEFELVKEHPTSGAARLRNMALGDAELWNGVMFHHEKVNGRGYPRGLSGKSIPVFSKIISVADVYDAVTSYRPYRSPMSPAMAFELICSDVESAFEYGIVKAFLERLEPYPTGSVIELSDKRLGVVTNNEIVLRPAVKLIDTGETLDLANLGNLSIIIARVLGPNEVC